MLNRSEVLDIVREFPYADRNKNAHTMMSMAEALYALGFNQEAAGAEMCAYEYAGAYQGLLTEQYLRRAAETILDLYLDASI